MAGWTGVLADLLSDTAEDDPVDGTPACARIALLAAMVVFGYRRHDGADRVDEPVRPQRLTNLFALKKRSTGRLEPNEVLLLVRC